jgi:RHS repeat-associated protein
MANRVNSRLRIGACLSGLFVFASAQRILSSLKIQKSSFAAAVILTLLALFSNMAIAQTPANDDDDGILRIIEAAVKAQLDDDDGGVATIISAVIPVCQAPIISPLVSGPVYATQTFTLTAACTKNPTTYIWSLNGVVIAGATSASIQVTIPAGITSAVYSVVAVGKIPSIAVAGPTLAVNLGAIPTSATPLTVGVTPPHLGNADAGTLPGSLSVSNNGAATYSMPIDVPPGTAGLKPSLSLNYSSQGTNGPLGLGWTLGGMSSIHRCGKTIAQDAVNQRITFTTADRLCLDGQRLVLVNKSLTDDNYWANDAEYRTELDSFSRITTAGASIAARSFKVESKDGRIMTFGSTSTSYVNAIVGAGVTAKGSALSWALDKIVDRSGNYVSFSYEQIAVTGEHRPTTIRYGGSGLASHAAVQFFYEARPDAWKRYVDEARNDLRSRTNQIKTYTGGNLDGDVVATGTQVRSYTLHYDLSPTSGRSMLDYVHVCARNPQTSVDLCLPKTTFAWGKPDANKAPGFVSRGVWANAPILTTQTVQGSSRYAANHAEYFAFVDFGNDGLTDVLEKRVTSPVTTATGLEVVTEDANSLGRGTLQQQYRYFHNTGSGFTQYNYKLNTNENFVVLGIADFNGDGSPDLLASVQGGGVKICLSPLGAAGGAPGNPATAIIFTCGSADNSAGKFSNSVTGLPANIGDVFGNGRAVYYSAVDDSDPTLVSPAATVCVPIADPAGPPGSLKGNCFIDANAPKTALGYVFSLSGNGFAPEHDYVKFSEMVDFAGTGRASDVRWTKPRTATTFDDNGTTKIIRCVNNKPTVNITSFPLPFPAATPTTPLPADTFTPYTYAPYFAPTPCLVSAGGYAPYSFTELATSASLTGDFNGSGYSSLAFGFTGFLSTSTVGGAFNPAVDRFETTICLSTGRGLDCGIRKKYSGTSYQPVRAVGQFVGDGQPSILVASASGTLQMCSVTGDDTTGGTGTNDTNMTCTPWPGVGTSTGSNSVASNKTYFMDLLGTGRTQIVLYRSGLLNNNVWTEDGRWEVFEPIDRAVAAQALDRIYQVTNGVGNTSIVEYVDGVPSGVVSRSASASTLTYPQHVTSGVGKIVSRLRVGNGVSADRTIKYTYKDAANDVNGRGSLGFREVTSTDEQTNIVTANTYLQAFPFTGMAVSSITSSVFGVMSNTQNRYTQKNISQANGAITVFPFMAGSVATMRDLDGTSSKGSVTTAGVTPAGADIADVQYDNWGNMMGTKVTSTGSALNAAYNSATSTINTFAAPNTTNWLVGLLQTSSVTKKQSTDAISVSRTVDYTYDADFSGRVKTETLQSADGTLAQKLTTTYNRTGSFGLVTEKNVKWRDLFTNGDVSQSEFTSYDPKGRFPNTVTNALSQSETHVYDAGSGAQVSLTGPNQLTTRWFVDGFGRVDSEARADGTETRQYRKQCSSGCPAGAVTAEISDSFYSSAFATRMAVPQVTYRDNAGHVLQTKTWGFDGREITADQNYDSLGRPYEAYQPRFATDQFAIARRQTYDDLGRVKTLSVFDEAGTQNTTTTTYAGFVVEMTNPKAQKRTDSYDVLGRVVQVKDANLKLTSFTYDPFGNLNKTTDPNGNVISVAYDDRGRKIKLTDPDLGIIDYFVDARGLTWKQISPVQRAANQSTRTEYDVLGRMTGRYEPDLESHWVFDTATKGIGQLAETYTGTATNKTYRRLHTYDGLSRPSTTTQTLSDGNYVASTGYDTWGRVSLNSYVRNSDTPKVFESHYNGYGYLSQLQRGSLVLWNVNKQDASQRPTEALLGNSLIQTRAYDLSAARLKNATLKTPSTALRLQEDYLYDGLANVTQRTQAWDTGSFTETFAYDVLNRLSTSTVTGQAAQSFTFDDTGNITAKTGVGSYVYPAQGPSAVRPHAIQSIPGVSTGNFAYDTNGNLASIPGVMTATWTSYDMPQSITKNGTGGTNASTFTYGPEHQRTKQVRSDGLTVVYAGAQEVETKGSAVTVKTYWPYGVGVEIDKPGTATELNWMHVDRLGSPIAISDNIGSLRERLAYDAWGKRRTLNGAPLNGTATPNSIDGITDNRGFTGHEMLDLLDLVHMNGRIYDPLFGKFLSADPLIQDPMNGQSYNRYSYVLNNPTNLTDPTGFGSICGDHISACGFTNSILSGVQEAAVAIYENLKPTSQAQVRDLVAQKNVKNDVPSGGGANSTDAKGRGNSKDESYIQKFAGELNFTELAKQAGRKLVDDFVKNNQSDSPKSNPIYQWVAGKLEGTYEKPDSTSANGITASVALTAATLYSPGGAKNQALALTKDAEVAAVAIWTAKRNETAVENAFAHFKKHGTDFASVNSVDFVRKAKDFLHHPPPDTLSKVRANGDVIRYNPGTNTFGVMDKAGSPRTFYKPDPALHKQGSNLDYFHAQK